VAWGVPKIGAVAAVASGNLTVAEPAGIATGDLMVACIAYRSNATFTVPGDWTIVATQQSSGDTDATNGIASGLMMWCVRGGSAPTLTFNRTAGDLAQGCIIAYTGGHASTPFDTGTANTLGAASATVTTGTFNTAEAGELIVAMVSCGDNLSTSAFDAATNPTTASGATDTTTAPTAGTWIERVDVGTNTGADGGLAIADAIRSAAGATGTIQATVSASARHVMIAAAFKLAVANPQTVTPAVGTVDAVGLAPTATVNTIAATGLGAVTAVGFAPTVITLGSTVELLEGATARASWTLTHTDSLVTAELTITSGELASITDWTAVRVRVTSTGIGAQAEVTWIELEVPAESPGVDVTVTPDLGVLTAAGLAPTVLTPTTVTPSLGELTAAGLAPTILTPTTVTPALGEVTAAGLAPTVTATANALITTDVGAAVAAGLAPTVTATDHQTVTPALGTVDAAGLAPAVTATANTHASTALGVVVADGIAPTVTATTNALVRPALGEVTVEGLAPTAEGGAGVTRTPPAGELTAAGLAPTVAVTDHTTVTPAPGTVDAAGLAPTVVTPVLVATDLGAVTAAGLAPTVTVSVVVFPATGEATIAGLAPTVLTPRTVTPALGTVAATGLEPTVLTPVTVVTATGEIDATGYVPTATVTAGVLVRPGVGAVEAVGYAPEIDTGATDVFPGTGTLTIRGLRPAVTVTTTASTGRSVSIRTADWADFILKDGGPRRGRRWW
jgi:hypothetical protein